MARIRTISPTIARRLAVQRQGLAGERREGIMELVRQIGCLQLDPTKVVERSHLLVLWSRLGTFDRAELDRLLWEERRLFEYWAHAASIVLTEDYPIHMSRMGTYRRGRGGSPSSRRFKEWAAQNAALRRHVISELRRNGPLPLSAFENRSSRSWRSTGGTAGREVDRMLGYLWMSGAVMVAGRRQGQRWWDLAERLLPDWTPKDRLSESEITRRTAQRSLRALGVARLQDINHHFVQGRPGLREVLTELEKSGTIVQVGIKDGSQSWPGVWYMHREDLRLIDQLEGRGWSPRTTLLSPFDNLIINRARTELLFGFHFRMEIYVPPSLRQHGYYVLPVLHGDQLAGRLDVAVSRAEQELQVRAAFAEKGADTPEVGKGVALALASLAGFVGANRISAPRKLPRNWKPVRMGL
jgi:uncharacterized protein YcaQ